MLLERTLRLALRNYGTLFLFVATVTVTLHLVYLFVFRDLAAVSDLHPAIEAFPPSRQVRGVGRADLSAWRSGAWIVAAVEIALIPLLARGAARVLEQDEAGEVPTLTAALRAFFARGYGGFPSPRDAGPVLVTAAFGVVVWWLVRTTAMLLVEPVGPGVRWAAFGLVEGVALAAAAPFFLVSVVLRKSRPKARAGVSPNPY